MSAELQRLKDIRKWNQDELADRLGVTQGYVSRLLKGKHIAGPKLKENIAALLDDAVSSTSDGDLMRRVANAAQRSEPYRQLLRASLLIFENIRK